MNTDDMPSICVSGTPRERGRAVAEELHSLMSHGLQAWLDSLGKARQADPETYLREFMSKTSYRSATLKLAPAAMQEVEGMAEALNVDMDIMFASQLHDEEWLYARDAQLRFLKGEGEKCSSIGINDIEGGPTVIAQNMDIGASWSDGLQMLVRHKYADSDLEVFSFCSAGNIALCGLNNAGIGVCCNTLMQLDHSAGGLPVTFVVRLLLEQTSFADAEAELRNIPHASGQNYLVGAPGAVGSFECSAKSVALHTPHPGLKRTYHTNHAFANRDQAIADSFLGRSSSAGLSWSPTTETRYEALERRMGPAHKDISIEDIKAALSSKDDSAGPVSRDKMSDDIHYIDGSDEHIGFTFGSLVMELAFPPKLHIAAGPPNITAYKTLFFD